MAVKLAISAAGNTYVPAYLVLLEKGYAVRREEPPSAGGEALWYAENEEHRFIAEDVLLLLGLVALYEARGEQWKASDAEIDDFISKWEYP
jgi:hypothetical protein